MDATLLNFETRMGQGKEKELWNLMSGVENSLLNIYVTF